MQFLCSILRSVDSTAFRRQEALSQRHYRSFLAGCSRNWVSTCPHGDHCARNHPRRCCPCAENGWCQLSRCHGVLHRRLYRFCGKRGHVNTRSTNPQSHASLQSKAARGWIYRNFGIEPLIQCAGVRTIYGASNPSDEVTQAMNAAAQAFVDLDELADAAGKSWRPPPASPATTRSLLCNCRTHRDCATKCSFPQISDSPTSKPYD